MSNDSKKILIIDDEKRIRTIYKRMLEEAGFTVYEASNADEATYVLIRNEIDLVLLDINMPQINGKTVFEIIQEYDPHVKVVVSSVYPIDVQKKMIPKAYDYHDKSHGPSILMDKVFSVAFSLH